MERRIKKVKLIFSLMKEKVWLEEMALQGYILEDIVVGIIYTFRVEQPRHLIYEIDRFDLPRNPSLYDIQEKELFMSLAEEMGWEQATHDEDMNYYFTREYQEGDVNELYTDEEMRRVHAQKYQRHYEKLSGGMHMVGVIFAILLLLEWLFLDLGIVFTVLASIATAYYILFGFIIRKFSRIYYDELRMETSEWIKLHTRNDNIKKCYGFFLSTKGLERFLNKQSRMGYHIVKMTDVRYYFEKGEQEDRQYCVDTIASVNYRRKLKQEQVIKDKKDIIIMNHDWQNQSVKDAAENGMKFICSCGNEEILYSGRNETVMAAPNRLLHALFVKMLLFLLGCGVVGFCLGILSGILTEYTRIGTF